jgi:hypothetical protein
MKQCIYVLEIYVTSISTVEGRIILWNLHIFYRATWHQTTEHTTDRISQPTYHKLYITTVLIARSYLQSYCPVPVDLQLCSSSWRTCSFACLYVLTQMFHLSLRSVLHVLSLVATFWHKCFTCLYVLALISFHFSLRPGTDVSLVITSWNRCFTCHYVLLRVSFHLSLRSDTDVSLVPTFFCACPFTFRYVLPQMFHLSLRSCAHFLSLFATPWYRCFTCHYFLKQMFHFSLRSVAHVLSLVTTFRHRCFTCPYVLVCMSCALAQMFHLSPCSRTQVFSPVTKPAHTLFHLSPRTGTHLVSHHYARDASGKTCPPEIKKYVSCFQPQFLLEYEAMHSAKCVPKFQKYQRLTYNENDHSFFWNVDTNIRDYRSYKQSHSTVII